MNNTNTKQDESYFKQDFQQLVYGGRGGKYFSSKGHIYKKIFIPQITVIYKQGHK